MHARVRIEVKVEVVPISTKLSVIEQGIAVKVLIEVNLGGFKVIGFLVFTEAWDVS